MYSETCITKAEYKYAQQLRNSRIKLNSIYINEKKARFFWDNNIKYSPRLICKYNFKLLKLIKSLHLKTCQ